MKKMLIGGVLAAALVVGTIQPVQAQTQTQNPFALFTESIKRQFQKMYLALPGEKDGKAVLQQSTLAMENVTSVTSSTDITVVAKGNEAELVRLHSVLSGPMKTEDVYDPTSYQQDMNVKAELAMEGTALSADADFKLDGQDVYMRINQLPAMPYFQVNQVKDKWIFLENPEASEAAQTELTDQQRVEYEQLYMDIVNEAEVSTARKETVDGVNAFVVDVTVNDDLIKRYFQRVVEIHDMPEEEATNLLQQVDRVLAIMSPLQSTVVVDRQNYYTRKVSTPLVFDLSSVDTSALTQLNATLPVVDLSTMDQVDANIVMTFDKYNQPVDFVVPADAQDMESVFGPALGGSMGATSPAEANRAMQLQDAAVQEQLKNLSPEELEMLKSYGIDPADLR